MSASDKEKAELGARTLQEFCEQFGDDVYARMLLDVLFEGLMNAETLFVFGEPQQARNQVGDSLANGSNSERPSSGSNHSESSADLATEDQTNPSGKPHAVRTQDGDGS